MNGVEVWGRRLFILTPKGIIEKEFSVSPKSLASIFAGDSEAEAGTSTGARRRKRDAADDDVNFASMCTEDIIRTMKKQRLSAGTMNETRMAQLLHHMVTRDPELQSVSTEQLIEHLLRVPFNAAFLTKQLQSLDPRLEARQCLLIVDKLLDRCDEHDELTLVGLQVCNCVLDASMTEILLHKNDLAPLIVSVTSKNDLLTSYCQSTQHLKAFVAGLNPKKPTRAKKERLEYQLTRMRI